MNDEVRIATLDLRVTNVEKAVEKIAASNESIAQSLQMIAATAASVKDHEARIRVIEQEMPATRQARNLFIGSIAAIVSAAAAVIFAVSHV